MQTTSQTRHIRNRFTAPRENTNSEYSQFVDRVNAQRFKNLVGNAANTAHARRPKLGLPFAVDRPEAAAAHRELEQELKPAARRGSERKFFSLSRETPNSGSARRGEKFFAALGLFGIAFAITIARSFK